jgi:hypothetical protein
MRLVLDDKRSTEEALLRGSRQRRHQRRRSGYLAKEKQAPRPCNWRFARLAVSLHADLLSAARGAHDTAGSRVAIPGAGSAARADQACARTRRQSSSRRATAQRCRRSSSTTLTANAARARAALRTQSDVGHATIATHCKMPSGLWASAVAAARRRGAGRPLRGAYAAGCDGWCREGRGDVVRGSPRERCPRGGLSCQRG